MFKSFISVFFYIFVVQKALLKTFAIMRARTLRICTGSAETSKKL